MSGASYIYTTAHTDPAGHVDLAGHGLERRGGGAGRPACADIRGQASAEQLRPKLRQKFWMDTNVKRSLGAGRSMDFHTSLVPFPRTATHEVVSLTIGGKRVSTGHCCYSSLKFLVAMGVRHINENTEGQ